MIDVEDTIVAIASPTTAAPRGVVRMSGASVVDLLGKLGIACPDGRRASRFDASIDVGQPIGTVPIAILLWPTGRSYTGQPSAELHTFGSLPILTAIVDAITSVGGRAARPGEFTMRAFLAGRLDLPQAEAVLGVIEAEHRGALEQALRQLAGNLSRPLEAMRSLVLDLLADVEAGLDFVDEDIEFISDAALVGRLREVESKLEATIQIMQARGGGAERSIVTLHGRPNAGKSSLMNRLTQREVAIVADLAGTTRDAVTAEADIGGLNVLVVDTAGLERPTNEISKQAQDHAARYSAEAIVRLWCVDAGRSDFDVAEREVREIAQSDRLASVVDLWIATKSDLQPDFDRPGWIACSAVSGGGVDRLTHEIAAALSAHDTVEIGSVVGTAARCKGSLERALTATRSAIELTESLQGHEFVSAELRLLAACLGEVTGAVYTDDILDRVFGRFCIGK